MKIDLIITELEVGGAERCCMELASYLHRNYHAVRMISIGSPPSPPRDALYREIQSQGIPFFSLHADRVTRFPLAWWRLRRLVRAHPPDIAQSFLWHANVLASSIYPKLHIPLVGGNRVTEPRATRHRLGRWAAGRMQRIVCVSQEVADWTAEAEGVASSKIVVIPNGISLSRWDAARLSSWKTVPLLPQDAPVLLFVGRIDHQKGIDILVERSPRILAELPDHHLVLLGDGPERAKAERTLSQSSVGSRIHWLGQSEEVPQWMRRSQLLLLPTRYEGMPNAVLEAMASSLPIATMEVEGMRELFGSLLPNQTVPRDRWNDWERLVIRLATTPALARELGLANRKRVEDSFSLQMQLKRYESLFRELAQ